MNIYIRAHDGVPVPRTEACDINGTLRSGYMVRAKLMRDEVTTDNAHVVKPTDNGRAAYEARISNAWKGNSNV